MSDSAVEFDVVVVGAGVSGLYALHHLRELGFTAHVIEAGDGVGGTWYWNRYPGARCDVPSMEYSYGFSPELEQEWDWTEVFPAQEELERVLQPRRRPLRPAARHPARHPRHRRDLRRSRARAGGSTPIAATAISCAVPRDGDGMPVGAARSADPGPRHVRGPLAVHERVAAEDDVDFTGLRVGLDRHRVVGRAGDAGDRGRRRRTSYVFQRTPSYAWPAGNRPLDPELQRTVKAQYRELRVGAAEELRRAWSARAARSRCRCRATSPSWRRPRRSASPRSTSSGWAACRAWSDVLTRPRGQRARRRAVPGDDAAGDRRSRDRRRPVAARPAHRLQAADPAHRLLRDVQPRRRHAGRPAARRDQEITPTGIRTEQGDFELDVIIFATGFDAMTGALDRIDIRGSDGVLLRDAWADGARMLLGIQTAGFPNFFTITGPGQPVGARQHGRVRRAAHRVDR